MDKRIRKRVTLTLRSKILKDSLIKSSTLTQGLVWREQQLNLFLAPFIQDHMMKQCNGHLLKKKQ